MNTSILWLILTAAVPAETTKSPSFLTDYGQAQRVREKEGRPLAVFLAPEKGSWQKMVTGDSKVSAEALKYLSDSYVCVHIDTATESGKRLAKEFDMSSGVGLILSDRSGEIQAYRHEGSLESSNLTSALVRHHGKKADQGSSGCEVCGTASGTCVSGACGVSSAYCGSCESCGKKSCGRSSRRCRR